MEQSETRSSLNALEQQIVKVNAPIVEHWQPGSHPDDLIAHMADTVATAIRSDVLTYDLDTRRWRRNRDRPEAVTLLRYL